MTSIDTSVIPGNITTENTSTTKSQNQNKLSHETLANPAIMVNRLAADIVFIMPTIIVIPPYTVESMQLCPNSLDVQNSFTVKYTTDKCLMSS